MLVVDVRILMQITRGSGNSFDDGNGRQFLGNNYRKHSPREKGANADFSLIISGYRYQRSGMNSSARA